MDMKSSDLFAMGYIDRNRFMDKDIIELEL